MKYLPAITKILREYGIREAAIFGSQARGEAKPGSDIDLLVKYPKGLSLFDVVRLQNELEESVGVKVDLVDRDHIKPRLVPYIMRDKKIALSL